MFNHYCFLDERFIYRINYCAIMKHPKDMTTEELIKLADEIKRGMGNILLEDYKKLKESFNFVFK